MITLVHWVTYNKHIFGFSHHVTQFILDLEEDEIAMKKGNLSE